MFGNRTGIDTAIQGIAAAQARRDADSQRVAQAADLQLRQAEIAVNDVMQIIAGFEATITQGEEVRVVMVGGPAGAMIFPENIVSIGSDRVLFVGRDNSDCRVVAMQHVSQLNVMLQAVPVPKDEARRTGFHAPGEEPEVATMPVESEVNETGS
jgi:hypothetical protein